MCLLPAAATRPFSAGEGKAKGGGSNPSTSRKKAQKNSPSVRREEELDEEEDEEDDDGDTMTSWQGAGEGVSWSLAVLQPVLAMLYCDTVPSRPDLHTPHIFTVASSQRAPDACLRLPVR